MRRLRRRRPDARAPTRRASRPRSGGRTSPQAWPTPARARRSARAPRSVRLDRSRPPPHPPEPEIRAVKARRGDADLGPQTPRAVWSSLVLAAGRRSRARFQFGDRPLVDDLPRAHDRHPIAQPLDLSQQMARQQHGHARRRRAAESACACRACRAGIEPGRRLVEQQQLRLAQQRGGDPETLAHAVRVPADLVIGASVSSTVSSAPSIRASAVAAVEAASSAQVGTRGQVRVEGGASTNPATPSSAAALSAIGSRPNRRTVPAVG